MSEMVAVGCGSFLRPSHAALVCGMECTEPVDVCRHLVDTLGCPKHFSVPKYISEKYGRPHHKGNPL